MEMIKIIQVGLNGQADFSIFDSKGKKIATERGIEAIAEEMKRLYPDHCKAMNIAFGSLSDVDEVDISTLSRDAGFHLRKIFR